MDDLLVGWTTRLVGRTWRFVRCMTRAVGRATRSGVGCAGIMDVFDSLVSIERRNEARDTAGGLAP